MTTEPSTPAPATPRVIVAGGGIAGLLLALALKKKLALDPVVYEQAPGFAPNIGGAIGLYANGLRVVRDIHPPLLAAIRAAGLPYLYRRWMRHDGTEVAVGEERHLSSWATLEDERDLASIGIRRWKLQQALADACADAGVAVRFGLRVVGVAGRDAATGVVALELSDGSRVEADLVFGCDGARSVLRGSLFPATEPEYTGVTCLMGAADVPRSLRGICFPSSSTSKFHACYYPTGPEEQIFQIYFPTPEKPETWKALSEEEGRLECEDLAAKMAADGWDKQFTEPLLKASSVLRTGLRARKPIPVWHSGRIVLLGDAAHPPVPYIGQGAMMAIEDVGILVTILKCLCSDSGSGGGVGAVFSFAHLETAFRLYERLRLPRTTRMLESSMSLGQMQLLRASDPSSAEVEAKEQSIKADVAKYGTLPIMKSGASYNYLEETRKALLEHLSSRVDEGVYKSSL
ncbi:hypothetical protein DFJ73DRAFT_5962 [Zopfochytrium polystomum]|nr:hypothetical protein DFJ73DRAFT_5962 [Zopfochytrium polystomum]